MTIAHRENFQRVSFGYEFSSNGDYHEEMNNLKSSFTRFKRGRDSNRKRPISVIQNVQQHIFRILATS